MNTSFFLFLLVVVFVAASIVVYALSRNRNVKALFKLPFAIFSFEAKQPGGIDTKAKKKRFSD